MQKANHHMFGTSCSRCADGVRVSLSKDFFICPHCGHRNSLEGKKFKLQREAITRKIVFDDSDSSNVNFGT